MTASLVFLPPKDSDELFDALRNKYPQIRTHSQRMREAVIEFLINEPQFEQCLTTPQATESNRTSPWQTSHQSFSSQSSDWSSPSAFQRTPTVPDNTPPRLHSDTSSLSSAAGRSPPALEHMTSVFSLADASQPKQRLRRKMTQAEKFEYRKRRIVKACEKCARRKRKCHHRQADMDQIVVSNPHRSSNAAGNPAREKPQSCNARDTGLAPYPSHANVRSLTDQCTGNEHVTNTSSEALPDLNMHDLFSSPWPWCDTQDFTLLTPGPNSQLTAPNDVPLGYDSAGMGVETHVSEGFWFDPDPDFRLAPQSFEYATHAEGSQFSGGSGNSIPWEHLSAGQEQREKPRATHTAQFPEGSSSEPLTYGALDSHVSCQASLSSAGLPDSSRQMTAHIDDHLQRNNSHASLDGTVAETQVLSELSSSAQAGSKTKKNRLPETAVAKSTADVLGEAPGCRPSELEEDGTQILSSRSITRRGSPATELYMLKRRLPRSLYSLADSDTDRRLAAPTPLLQIIAPLQPPLQHSYASAMGVTRNTDIPRQSSSLLYNSPLDATVEPSSSGSMHDAYGLRNTASGPYADRLSDHFRCRDHFGRNDQDDETWTTNAKSRDLFSLVAGLCGLLVLVSMLPSHNGKALLCWALLTVAFSCPMCRVKPPYVEKKTSRSPETLEKSVLKCTSMWLHGLMYPHVQLEGLPTFGLSNRSSLPWKMLKRVVFERKLPLDRLTHSPRQMLSPLGFWS